jgi:3D (Asp-Asp-Asp) domain-containing protein
MGKYIFFLIIPFFLYACGGGEGKGNNNSQPNNTPSLKEHTISAQNIKECVGFEITLNLTEGSNYSIEKSPSIKNWNLKYSLKENKVKIIAFNPDLKPIGKNESTPLIKIKIPSEIQISSITYKVVDDFGNPIKGAEISVSR